MSGPQLVNGPAWIHECQHMTISPEDPCSHCAAIAQAVKEERERCIAIVEEYREANEKKYYGLETATATDTTQRTIRRAAQVKMGHDVIIKNALAAGHE